MIKSFILFIILVYKKFFSPILKVYFGGGCRYKQSCSDHAFLSIKKYGVIKGLGLFLKRFIRCNFLALYLNT